MPQLALDRKASSAHHGSMSSFPSFRFRARSAERQSDRQARRATSRRSSGLVDDRDAARAAVDLAVLRSRSQDWG
jgi:hypothetical protein